MTGVDASHAMLALAAARTRRAKFIHSPMASFGFDGVCDAAVCFYNSLNHALSGHELQATLRSVRRQLRLGGTFVFDFVSSEGYGETWNGTETVTCEDRTCTVRYEYDPVEQLAVCRIDVRSHVNLAGDLPTYVFYQRPLSLQHLEQELAAAGFRIGCIDRAHSPAKPPDGRVAVAAIAIPI